MKRIIAGLLAAACVLVGLLFWWLVRTDDVTAPVITFSDETIVYVEGEDTSVLLEGVKAVDDVDGDVSDTLLVESVVTLQSGTSATVLYSAKDSSNNVAKASRVVEYQTQGQILLPEETESESETETQDITESSESSEDSGDGESGDEDSVSVSVSAGTYPVITLTTDSVTVQDGEEYNLLSYVKEVSDDVDTSEYLYRQIYIAGKNDISGPGTYELYYSVTDSEGNVSEQVKLIFTIE